MENKVVAICVADIHLTLRPPVARSAEPCWLGAMKRQLKQLRDLGKSFNHVPIIYAGDIFDKHNPVPELINFAAKNLPNGYAVPGQHDLPNHRYEDLQKSAYWTLMEVGVLTNIPYRESVGLSSVSLHGFPWGRPLEPLQREKRERLEMAVVHDYCWMPNHGSYPGADQEKRIKNRKQSMTGYDVVIFGDNHTPLQSGKAFNCGSFFRRKADERNHRPSAGLIHADGTVTRHYFDCSEDKFLDDEELAKAIMEEGSVDELVKELAKLTDVAIDFAEALKRRVDKVDKSVRNLALEFMEQGK